MNRPTISLKLGIGLTLALKLSLSLASHSISLRNSTMFLYQELQTLLEMENNSAFKISTPVMEEFSSANPIVTATILNKSPNQTQKGTQSNTVTQSSNWPTAVIATEIIMVQTLNYMRFCTFCLLPQYTTWTKRGNV